MFTLEMIDKLFSHAGRMYRGMRLPTFERPRTGIRQGKRLARQKAAGMLDFSASERCIASIKEREKRHLAQRVAERMETPITHDEGRQVPPHRNE